MEEGAYYLNGEKKCLEKYTMKMNECFKTELVDFW